MRKVNMKTYTIFMTLIAFFAFFLYTLEQDKQERLRRVIVEFHSKYEAYLDLSLLQDDFGYEFKNMNYLAYKDLNSSQLEDLYGQIRGVAFSTIAQRLESYENEWALYQSMSTQHFSSESIREIEHLNGLIHNLVSSVVHNYDIMQLDQFGDLLDSLRVVYVREFDRNKEVAEAFNRAQLNKETASQVDEDCFSNQNNEHWTFSQEVSFSFCHALGLDNCNIVLAGNNVVYGYTRNKPRLVNHRRGKYFDFVSYDRNINIIDRVNDAIVVNEDEQVFVEVYVKQINGRNIYKFNVVVLADDFEMTCDIED